MQRLFSEILYSSDGGVFEKFTMGVTKEPMWGLASSED